MKMYTDGGARGNPGPAAIGVLLCEDNEQELLRHCDTIGEATNNIAEYCALIAGLEIAISRKVEKLDCFLDSELVVKQMNGVYRVKQPHIKQLFLEVQKNASKIKEVSYTHLRREHPQMRVADSLVNKALDGGV